MVITPDTRKEVKLPSGITVKLRPISARNFHTLMSLTKLEGKIDKKSGRMSNLSEEDSRSMVDVVVASIDSWDREEECTKNTILDTLLFADIIDLFTEVVDLNFRDSEGDQGSQKANKAQSG